MKTESSEPQATVKPKSPHGVQPGSVQANRIAIAVLEVLAGERTPSDAASALGVSLPRFYQLETRAVNGLVAACEPRPKGKRPSLDKQVARLEQALAAAQQEVSRQQSLVRAAHRSLGLKAAPAANSKKKPKGKKRERRPTRRALKAVAALAQENARDQESAAVQPTTETDTTSAGGESS